MSAKILIQFPTRGRPGKFLTVLKKYIEYLSDKDNFIVNVSCDLSDNSMFNDRMIDKVSNVHENVFLNFNDNQNKIQAVNAGVDQYVNDIDIILLASDDMIPRERAFDTVIRHYFKTYFPNYDGVIHFDDGHRHDKLNTLSILGVEYYKRFGYLYHPSYKSLWADNEFDLVSRIYGKRKYIEQMIIKHEHPAVGAPVDDMYIINNKYEMQDKKNFLDRQRQNFGLK